MLHCRHLLLVPLYKPTRESPPKNKLENLYKSKLTRESPPKNKLENLYKSKLTRESPPKNKLENLYKSNNKLHNNLSFSLRK